MEFEWLLIVISVFTIWIASFCKIFVNPTSTSFLCDGRTKNVLLVIAHPDDESMFFTPTINFLLSRGHNLYILCLSTGNADGLGSLRREEFYRACAVLQVPLDKVKIIDHPDLQDGFGHIWNHNLLAKTVGDAVSQYVIDTVITFDRYGVSGHCNHCDVHFGVRKLLHDMESPITAWELVSTNILRKYIGPIDLWCAKLFSMKSGSETIQFVLNKDPLKSFRAMAEHSSQWLWFRKLFVSLSSYSYVNSLKRIC